MKGLGHSATFYNLSRRLVFHSHSLMASNEAVLVENSVSKLYYLQFITIKISTFIDEHLQLVQFHLKPSSKETVRCANR